MNIITMDHISRNCQYDINPAISVAIQPNSIICFQEYVVHSLPNVKSKKKIYNVTKKASQ